MTDDTDITDMEKAQKTLKYVRGSFGNADLAKALAGKDSPIDVEPLDDETARERFTTFLYADGVEPPSIQSLTQEVITEDHLAAVENEALHIATERATQHVEQGVDRPKAVYSAASEMPDHLAKEFVQAELDMAESTGYDQPQDFADDLTLLRLEVDLWDDPTHNLKERLTVWDEMLKFTSYRSDITYRREEGGITRTDTTHIWAQSSADAHNQHLRSLKRQYDGFVYESGEQIPEERFFPDWDPLPDVEDFVFPEEER